MEAPQLPDPADCATVWFARLEHAKENHLFEEAARAVRELRRLGVKVEFLPERKEADRA